MTPIAIVVKLKSTPCQVPDAMRLQVGSVRQAVGVGDLRVGWHKRHETVALTRAAWRSLRA